MGKQFHLGDLLSITDGHLVSPRHMDGVYDIVDFVTGQLHFTHQLCRGAEVVKPWLLEQHPWLASIEVPDDLNSKETVLGWLAGAVERHGEYHEVNPMPFGMYVGREAIAELREMIPPHAEIFTVDLSGVGPVHPEDGPVAP